MNLDPDSITNVLARGANWYWPCKPPRFTPIGAENAMATPSIAISTPDGIFSADRVEALVLAEELIADGHVVVTRGDLEARAAHAVFRQQAGQAELSGGAVVHLGRNTMEAPTITVDLRARRVTAPGGAHLVGYPP